MSAPKIHRRVVHEGYADLGACLGVIRVRLQEDVVEIMVGRMEGTTFVPGARPALVLSREAAEALVGLVTALGVEVEA